jgi:hypothetical protein
MTDIAKYKVRYDADIAASNIFAGDSDQVVTDYYNASDVSPDAEIRASREQIMEAIDVTEFKALAAASRDAVVLVLLPDSVVIRGSNARAIILDAFGPATATRANLLALQTQLENDAERTRAQRGEILGNSLSVSLGDTTAMRAI